MFYVCDLPKAAIHSRSENGEKQKKKNVNHYLLTKNDSFLIIILKTEPELGDRLENCTNFSELVRQTGISSLKFESDNHLRN